MTFGPPAAIVDAHAGDGVVRRTRGTWPGAAAAGWWRPAARGPRPSTPPGMRPAVT